MEGDLSVGWNMVSSILFNQALSVSRTNPVSSGFGRIRDSFGLHALLT